MTVTTLLAATTSVPSHLDPIKLFLDAAIVVKVVMTGLLLASVWSWTIIISASLKLARVRRGAAAYEKAFWAAKDPAEFHASNGKADVASARVVTAGLEEWKASARNRPLDPAATRGRLAQAMEGAVAEEADALGVRLNFLATVASSAPFIGLFGTVWGIMNSFFDIGAQQNSSLAVVAPGISEALFATAIGLFAAIPALIAYNRLTFRVGQIEAGLYRFADRLHATLSRELDGR